MQRPDHLRNVIGQHRRASHHSREVVNAGADRGGIRMRFRPGVMAVTLFGWTPGLRRTVAGRVLACGCLVGAYETRNGQIAEILDDSCESCRDPYHNVNRVLSVTSTT